MELAIGENYRLTTDPMNVILQERKMSKPTEAKPESVERWDTLGYYATVEQAVTSLQRMEIKHSESATIGELIQAIKASENRIESAVHSWKKRL